MGVEDALLGRRGGGGDSRLLLGLLGGGRSSVAAPVYDQSRGPSASERTRAPGGAADDVETSPGRVEGHGHRVEQRAERAGPFRTVLETLTSGVH